MCSLSIECVLLHTFAVADIANVLRMCSLSIECVLLHTLVVADIARPELFDARRAKIARSTFIARRPVPITKNNLLAPQSKNNLLAPQITRSTVIARRPVHITKNFTSAHALAQSCGA